MTSSFEGTQPPQNKAKIPGPKQGAIYLGSRFIRMEVHTHFPTRIERYLKTSRYFEGWKEPSKKKKKNAGVH